MSTETQNYKVSSIHTHARGVLQSQNLLSPKNLPQIRKIYLQALKNEELGPKPVISRELAITLIGIHQTIPQKQTAALAEINQSRDPSLHELKVQQAQELSAHTKSQLSKYLLSLGLLLILGLVLAAAVGTGGLGLLIPVIGGVAFLGKGTAIGLLVGGAIGATATFLARKTPKYFLNQRPTHLQNLQNKINELEKSHNLSPHSTFNEVILNSVKDNYENPGYLNCARHLTLDEVQKVILFFERAELAFYTNERLSLEAARTAILVNKQYIS